MVLECTAAEEIQNVSVQEALVKSNVNENKPETKGTESQEKKDEKPKESAGTTDPKEDLKFSLVSSDVPIYEFQARNKAEQIVDNANEDTIVQHYRSQTNLCDAESIDAQLKEHKLDPLNNDIKVQINQNKTQYDTDVKGLQSKLGEYEGKFNKTCEDNSSDYSFKKKTEAKKNYGTPNADVMAAVQLLVKKLSDNITSYSSNLKSIKIDYSPLAQIDENLKNLLDLMVLQCFVEKTKSAVDEKYPNECNTVKNILNGIVDSIQIKHVTSKEQIKNELIRSFWTNLSATISDVMKDNVSDGTKSFLSAISEYEKSMSESTNFVQMLELMHKLVSQYNELAPTIKKNAEVKVNDREARLVFAKTILITVVNYYLNLYTISKKHITKYKAVLEQEVDKYKNNEKAKKNISEQLRKVAIHKKETPIKKSDAILASLEECIDLLKKMIQEIHKASDMNAVRTALQTKIKSYNRPYIQTVKAKSSNVWANAMLNVGKDKKQDSTQKLKENTGEKSLEIKEKASVDYSDDQQLWILLPPPILIYQLVEWFGSITDVNIKSS
jgi:hypothetical protein